jgi:hypothetical protein
MLYPSHSLLAAPSRLCSPDFRSDYVSSASHACGHIVKWIRSVYAVRCSCLCRRCPGVFLARNPCLLVRHFFTHFPSLCAGVDEPCNPFIPPPAAIRSKTLMPYVHVMSTYLQRSRLLSCPQLQVNRDQASRHFHHRCNSQSGCCVGTFYSLSSSSRSPLPSLSSRVFFTCFPPFLHGNKENGMVCPMRHSVRVRPARTGTRVTQKRRAWVYAGR